MRLINKMEYKEKERMKDQKNREGREKSKKNRQTGRKKKGK